MTPFRLMDAHSAAEAAALLRAHGPRAQAIAAGGDLLGLLKEGVTGPALPLPQVLVNLATAVDMALIHHMPDSLQLGAMTTLAQLRRAPGLPLMLAEALDHIASPQLRARTTLGGNLLQRPRCLYFRHPDVDCFKKGGTGCPAIAGLTEAWPGALFPGACNAGHPSDLAPVLVALDAQAVIVGPGGMRSLPLARLYQGAASNPQREALLATDELLACLRIPNGWGPQAFEKVAPRPANEFAWAGAAVALQHDAGRITAARMALSGIAPAPHLLEGASTLLAGKSSEEIDPASIAQALLPTESITPSHRQRLPAAHLAIERALARALRPAPQ